MASARTNKLSIRVSPEEYKYFLASQRDSNMTQADFLIKLLDNWNKQKEKGTIEEK